MLFALFALLAAEPAIAKEKPLKCDWKGDAVDPFTGKDSRFMALSYFYTYFVNFQRPVDGMVPIEVKFNESGMTSNVVDKPIMFLLADGSVVEVPLRPAAPPVHGASSYGVTTVHTAVGAIPLDAVKKFVDIGTTRIRFPVPNKEWTREMDKGDIKDFTLLSRCLLEP